MDERQYPTAFEVPGGRTVCLPYLAALIRLCDEIDVTASRNPALLYDLESFTEETSILEHKKHKAVKELIVSHNAFTMLVSTREEDVMEGLIRMRDKMQHTLDECRQAVTGRTPFVITQEKVLIRETCIS